MRPRTQPLRGQDAGRDSLSQVRQRGSACQGLLRRAANLKRRPSGRVRGLLGQRPGTEVVGRVTRGTATLMQRISRVARLHRDRSLLGPPRGLAIIKGGRYRRVAITLLTRRSSATVAAV